MASLNNLHRRLYTHNNDDLINRGKSPDDYSDEKKSEEETQKKISVEKGKDDNSIPFVENTINNQDEIAVQPKIETISSKFKKRKIRIIGGFLAGLLLIIGGVIGYIKYKQGSFSQERVVIEFQGNQEIKSGETFDYSLLIHNNNRVALKNSQIIVDFPEELTPVMMSFMKENADKSFSIDIGEIKAQETKIYQLKFNVFSSRGGQLYLNTNFLYEPTNFSSVFKKEDNHSVLARGAIVDFSLVSQQEIASGETLRTVAVLTNNTVNDINNLILELQYPDEFTLSKLDLENIENSVSSFKIPTLKAQSKTEVEILGNFIGEVDSIKKITGVVGVLDEKSELLEISIAEETVKVIPARITISQNVVSGINPDDSTTYLGTLLKYKIDFKNNSTNPLSDLVLKEKLNGDLFEHSSVKATDGYYNQESQEIIWKASDISSLKNLNPGESGTVEFELKLKDTFFPDEDETNQTLATQTKISSLNINTTLLSNKEISSGSKKIKINTNLDILVSGEFEGTVFKNNGPFPLEPGEETTLTIKIELKNNLNKIDKPNLTIKLPSGIIWKDSFHRSSGNVSFNERTNELNWELSSINSEIGYRQPAEELLFQIGVNPQTNNFGGSLKLINSVNFTGFENFVEREIKRDLREFILNDIKDYEF